MRRRTVFHFFFRVGPIIMLLLNWTFYTTFRLLDTNEKPYFPLINSSKVLYVYLLVYRSLHGLILVVVNLSLVWMCVCSSCINSYKSYSVPYNIS